MDRDHFVGLVAMTAGISREDAERAVEATLQTLAERITGGEARQLAERLAPELAPWLNTTEPAEPFDVDEFVRRVAEREGSDAVTAERHARAVMAVLMQAVGPKEFDDVVAQLPRDFAPLLARGEDLDLMSAEEFWQRVAARAGLDPERARRATAAVLETLAERIAVGEVDDLIARLDLPLHEPLKVGRAHGGGVARRMPFERFVQRIAEREGVTPSRALADARAVMTTLREAIGDDEFFDVTVQLPGDYVAALAPARA
jgi:uncharacterized protein (DUF2267 family)